MKRPKNLLPVLLFLFPFLLSAQDKLDNAAILELVKSEVKASSNENKQFIEQLELKIQDHQQSKQSKIDHYYFRQKHQGLDIYGSESSIHILPNGKVLKLNNRMSAIERADADESIKPSLTAIQAVEAAAKHMNYGLSGSLDIIEPAKGIEQQQLISKGNISQTEIPAKLLFHQTKRGVLLLAWDISIQEVAGEDWWSMRIDARTGELLDQNNWVVHCNHGTLPADFIEEKFPLEDKHIGCTEKDHAALIGGYRVFAAPLSDPSDGSRTLEVDPDNATASPFGWHDTDGAAGAEFTTTQGNNVHAYDDGNNPGYSPDGGASLQFDFPLDLNADPELYEDAGITNIFYWGNKVHDILYQYGFDEASGNFQENNYGNGGAGSDYVNIRVQTSLTCNGSFGTPSDGNNPTMTMYICNGRDGAFNNTTTIHEYGHGVSNRLTGGPSTTGCLSNQEQMGEGWSDYLAMLMTIESTDTRTTTRAYGDWFYGNPNGIRPYVYNTDITVNSATYNNIDGVSIPHGVGNVWATMLWEMSWNLIDNYGFDTDLYTGTGGNNIALQLVIEGMKLQPCSPGFVDGRDAILAADVALYGGANECFIWEAFAKRGLGINASQGSTGSVTDGTESFSLPVSCGGTDCSVSFASTDNVTLSYLAANNQTFDVVSNGIGTWEASTSASWITINSPVGSVAGNGTVDFSVTENLDPLPRVATIEVTCDGSFTIYYTINQERQPCAQAYAPVPYSTGFESGSLDAYWCATSSESDGRIQVTTLNAPRTGSYHMTLDVSINGVYNTNEAALGLQLAGESNVELSFWWKEFADENNVEDGVFFSDDGGLNYVKVYDLTGGSTTYTEVILDVSQLAAANSLSLTDNFVVKFQQYDNYAIATDGFAFDDISVTSDACTVGAACDDNDDCTINDVYDATCTCVGTFQDSDNDTVCDADDVCPGFDDLLDTNNNGIPDDCEGCTNTVVNFNNFDSGWGIWNDGGSDCRRSANDAAYAYSGSRCVRLRDNTSTSVTTTDNIDASMYQEMTVNFTYYPRSMDNSNEDFWLQLSTDGGATFTTVESWVKDTEFVNDQRYFETVLIPGPFTGTTQLRFRCDASGNSDWIYLDDIEIVGCTNPGALPLVYPNDTPIITNNLKVESTNEEFSINVYPNPFANSLTIALDNIDTYKSGQIVLFDITGRRIYTDSFTDTHVIRIDDLEVPAGQYFIAVVVDDRIITKKLLRLR